MKKSRSYIAFPPGVTIKEQLMDRGMSQKEFAVRMGMSEKHISKLINGEVQLTIEAARKLEMVLGLPTQFWCNLEIIYREKIAKVNDENAMEEDIIIAKKMPYRKMVKNGWIADTEQWTDRVVLLRKYFEVAQLTYIQSSLISGAACRKLFATQESDYALISWIQRAKLETRNRKVKFNNAALLTAKMEDIIKMIEMPFEKAAPELVEILASCGIALVILPAITPSLRGVTFLAGDKMVIGLAEETNSTKLWYSLFHELAHVLYGHVGNPEGISSEDEKQANEYAAKALEEVR